MIRLVKIGEQWIDVEKIILITSAGQGSTRVVLAGTDALALVVKDCEPDAFVERLVKQVGAKQWVREL